MQTDQHWGLAYMYLFSNHGYKYMKEYGSVRKSHIHIHLNRKMVR